MEGKKAGWKAKRERGWEGWKQVESEGRQEEEKKR